MLEKKRAAQSEKSHPLVRASGRNTSLLDRWSFVHIGTGILCGIVLDPLLAFIVMTLWEPFELFLLSPFLARFGVTFGYESWQNVASDIVMNSSGILLGYLFVSNI